MTAKNLKTSKLDKNTVIYFVQKNKVRIALLFAVLVTILFMAFFLFGKKEPKTYEEYMAQMSETLAMEELATNASAAYQGIEDQIGYDAYEALVLGVPVEEGSLYYETQQNNFAAAKNEAEYAQDLVKQHESEIRAMGGIVDLKDLERVDTEEYTDAMARAKIQGHYDEYIANLAAGGDKALEEARRAAAYVQ